MTDTPMTDEEAREVSEFFERLCISAADALFEASAEECGPIEFTTNEGMARDLGIAAGVSACLMVLSAHGLLAPQSDPKWRVLLEVGRGVTAINTVAEEVQKRNEDGDVRHP